MAYATVLEPLLIAVMGLVVLLIVLAVLDADHSAQYFGQVRPPTACHGSPSGASGGPASRFRGSRRRGASCARLLGDTNVGLRRFTQRGRWSPPGNGWGIALSGRALAC